MGKILIKNGKVWDGEKFSSSDILTEKGVISKIEPEITIEADFTFDAAGKIVSPGLTDLHVHLKGISSDEFGTLPEMSSFPFGVTSVCDAGGGFGDKRLLDSFSVKSKVFVSVDIKDNRADFKRAEENLAKYGDRAIGLKVYFDRLVSPVSDITPLKEISDYGNKNGLKVMVHSSNSPASMREIVDALNPGDILTHAYHGGENSCIVNNFEALRLAKEKGVIIDTGFAGYVHTDFKNFYSAVKNGFIPDTISTDITCLSAFKRGGRYGMTMCMSIAKESGMSIEEIFRAVTISPAKALGMENSWGALKVGRCADIAVFDYVKDCFDLTDKSGNNIKSDKGYRCVLTLSDGEVVYRI